MKRVLDRRRIFEAIRRPTNDSGEPDPYAELRLGHKYKLFVTVAFWPRDFNDWPIRISQSGDESDRSEQELAMKRFFLTVILSIIGAGSALAADFPQPAPPPPEEPAYLPTTVPVYNWGGIYFGLNGGWAFGASNWTGGAATSGSFDTSGAVFGGTAGVNVQAEQFVFTSRPTSIMPRLAATVRAVSA